LTLTNTHSTGIQLAWGFIPVSLFLQLAVIIQTLSLNWRRKQVDKQNIRERFKNEYMEVIKKEEDF